jgi:hypothetical protein
MLSVRSFVSFAAFTAAIPSLAACGSSEFTCDESRTCPSPNQPNQPDGASGSGGSAGTGGTVGSAGSAGDGGSAASGGSAGSSGSAGSAGSGGSAGEDGGAGSAGAAGSAGTTDAGPDADSGMCAVGTEGCACTAARGCNSGLLCKGATCAKPVCGDSRVEGNEFCDDGRNLGTAVGDCAPDCSITVVQKKIVMSEPTVLPNLARDGAGFVVDNADAHCPAGYKALFADGLKRIATVTPNKGDGRKDWALRPWTRYVNPAGAPIWTTNQSALLGVVDGKFQGLTNRIAGLDQLSYAVTGMNADWTTLPAGDKCSNWTNLANDYLQIGIPYNTTTGFLQADDRTPYPCDPRAVLMKAWSVYCVEQ